MYGLNRWRKLEDSVRVESAPVAGLVDGVLASAAPRLFRTAFRTLPRHTTLSIKLLTQGETALRVTPARRELPCDAGGKPFPGSVVGDRVRRMVTDIWRDALFTAVWFGLMTGVSIASGRQPDERDGRSGNGLQAAGLQPRHRGRSDHLAEALVPWLGGVLPPGADGGAGGVAVSLRAARQSPAAPSR